MRVNYVGKAASLYDAGYELNGSVYVISKFIGNTWLWDQVCVSSGAYGGFCDFDSQSGSFSCLTHVSMSVECSWSSTGDTNAYLITRISYILTYMPRLRFVSCLKAYLHTSNLQGCFLSSHTEIPIWSRL
jgi:Zn-dependent M16 (insulinase) family peptidase